MDRIKSYLIFSLLASTVVAFSACNTMIHYHRTVAPVVVEKEPGPPPHAPAHGYRHRHSDGLELVYQASLGLYVVVGYTDHYYDHGVYYRWHDATWQMSPKFNRGWAPVSEKKMPPGLRRTHVCKKGT